MELKNMDQFLSKYCSLHYNEEKTKVSATSIRWTCFSKYASGLYLWNKDNLRLEWTRAPHQMWVHLNVCERQQVQKTARKENKSTGAQKVYGIFSAKQ